MRHSTPKDIKGANDIEDGEKVVSLESKSYKLDTAYVDKAPTSAWRPNKVHHCITSEEDPPFRSRQSPDFGNDYNETKDSGSALLCTPPSSSSVGCAPMKPRRRSVGGRSIKLRVSMVNGTYKLVARYGDNHIQG